jgi:hypothetical protein
MGFLHRCANKAWKVKGIENPHHSILCTFYRWRVLVTLQHAQVASILRRVVIICEGSSRLGVLSGGSLISLFDICFLWSERFPKLDVPLVVYPFRWFICFLKHESFHFVPCIHAFFFFGALIFLMIGGFIIICVRQKSCILKIFLSHLMLSEMHSEMRHVL